MVWIGISFCATFVTRRINPEVYLVKREISSSLHSLKRRRLLMNTKLIGVKMFGEFMSNSDQLD